MKRSILILMMCAAFQGAALAQKTAGGDSNEETIVFVVTNKINCGNCVRKINDGVRSVRGVTGIEIDAEKDLVTITYRKDRTSSEKLKAAFAKIDKEVEEVKKADE
jgi:copper chaperone CopZ